MLFTISSLAAQDDLDNLFDDDITESHKGAIKLDATAVYAGELILGYEHFFRPRISVLVGAGPRIGFYNKNISNLFGGGNDFTPEIKDVTGGYGYLAELRWYFNDLADNYFVALNHRGHNIGVEASSENYLISESGLLLGFTKFFGQHFHAEYGIQGTYRSYNDAAKEGFINSSSSFSEEDLAPLGYDIIIRLGYRF